MCVCMWLCGCVVVWLRVCASRVACVTILFGRCMHHARMQALATVLLDPYPFGGGTTTLEAFNLCQPVVTLPSKQTVAALAKGMVIKMQRRVVQMRTLVQRDGTYDAVKTLVDLDQALVAHTVGQYVEKASNAVIDAAHREVSLPGRGEGGSTCFVGTLSFLLALSYSRFCQFLQVLRTTICRSIEGDGEEEGSSTAEGGDANSKIRNGVLFSDKAVVDEWETLLTAVASTAVAE